MTEKRYRSEHIVGTTLPFIVDNYSAKEHNKHVSYKAYETTTMEKCDELTDLLNNYEERIIELEKENYKLKKENHRLNAKVNRLTDELAYCYEKLGW